MTRPIASSGNVHYNGFDFPAPLSLKVRCVPNYDAAHATVKHRTYNVVLETILVADDFEAAAYGGPVLAPGDPVDAALAVLRKKLTEPGKTLKLKNQGLGGDLTVNYANAIGRGPSPKMLAWEPMGGNCACRIVWECEFTVAECDPGILTNTSSLGEFSYTVDFSLTPDGLTQVTLAGLIEVNVHRMGEIGLAWRQIDHTADQLREQINFFKAVNVERRRQYRLSEDRRFLHFTITDTEIGSENPYFPGCVRMDVQQRLNSKGPTAYGVRFDNGISGRIEVAPGFPKKLAWYAFVWVVKARYKKFNPTPDENSAGTKSPKILRHFDITEDIFGRGMSFSLAWDFVSDRETLLEQSGLWEPIPGSWNNWRSSLSQNVDAVYGPAGAMHRRTDDNLIDFCLYVPSQPLVQPEPPLTRMGAVPQIFSPPGKDESWLQYTVRIHLVQGGADGAVILSRPLGPSSKKHFGWLDFTPADNGGEVGDNAGSGNKVDLQHRADPVYFLKLTGTARRVAHKIETDELAVLDKIGDEDAATLWVMEDMGVNELRGEGQMYGVYKRKWSVVYALPKNQLHYTVKNWPKDAFKWKGG